MSLPVLLSLIAALQLPPTEDANTYSIDILAEFDAVCLAWDGTPTEAGLVAERRGYAPAPERVPEDLFQRSSLQVWVKSDDQAEAMAITKRAEIIRGFTAPIRQCFVSLQPGNLTDTRRALRERLGFDGFRQEDTFIFPWTPTPDGGHAWVRLRDFDRNLTGQIIDNGMRYISLTQQGDQVILGYVAPRDAPTVQAPSVIE